MKIKVPCQECLTKPMCINRFTYMTDCIILMEWISNKEVQGYEMIARFHMARYLMGTPTERVMSRGVLANETQMWENTHLAPAVMELLGWT